MWIKIFLRRFIQRLTFSHLNDNAFKENSAYYEYLHNAELYLDQFLKSKNISNPSVQIKLVFLLLYPKKTDCFLVSHWAKHAISNMIMGQPNI